MKSTDTPAHPDQFWHALAAPVPPDTIMWRQDGKPKAGSNGPYARFVPYIDAGIVRARLDAVAPGRWMTSLTPLPPVDPVDPRTGEVLPRQYSFACLLSVAGAAREDVGTGDDYKAAATDAFKRAAVRFGVGHELYDMSGINVPMDGDGKYAKPTTAPALVYARKAGLPTPPSAPTALREAGMDALAQNAVRELDMAPHPADEDAAPATTPAPTEERACPVCSGRMWDNREGKRNPKAPDFKCRDKSCEGVIWPPRGASAKPVKALVAKTKAAVSMDSPKREAESDFEDFPGALQDEVDDLPF